MVIDADDVALIKRYVLHETLLVVLDRDKKAIEASMIKIKEPYLSAIENAIKTSIASMTEIKQEMKRRGVRILFDERTDYGTKVKYIARGYENTTEFWEEHMRAEVWVLINKYVFGKEE